MPIEGFGGHVELTSAEREVLEILARGRSDEEIATELSVSETAVRSRLHRFYDRTGITSPRRVVAWAKDHLHCCIHAA